MPHAGFDTGIDDSLGATHLDVFQFLFRHTLRGSTIAARWTTAPTWCWVNSAARSTVRRSPVTYPRRQPGRAVTDVQATTGTPAAANRATTSDPR